MIGQSAGRSRRHPTGEGAIARSTPRQRAYEAPPPTGSWVTIKPREKYVATMRREMIVVTLLIAISVALVLAADDWRLEVIGFVPVLCAVAYAGISQPWRRIRTDLVMEDGSKVTDRH